MKPDIVEIAVAQLEEILSKQYALYSVLLDDMQQKRDAIRVADFAVISSIAEHEGKCLEELAKLDRQRLQITGHIAGVKKMRPEDLTISHISTMVKPPQQERLRALSEQVRAALDELRRQSSIVRAAAEALSQHMSGIVQSVSAAFSRARVYGHRGRIASALNVQSAVDIKS